MTIAALLALILAIGTTTFGQSAPAMKFNQGNDRFVTFNMLTGSLLNNFNYSLANLFIVPGSVLPIPEPNAAVLAIAGGVILLLLSRKRIHN